MSCLQIRSHLPALQSGELNDNLAARCRAHLESCDSCRARLAELETTSRLLRRLDRDEPAPVGLLAGLEERLAREPAPAVPLAARLFQLLEPLRLDSAPRLAFAMAALCLIVATPLVLSRYRTPTGAATGTAAGPDQEVAAAFRVPQERIAVVRFDFVADISVADVEFEVTLPAGLYFFDDGRPLSDRKLVWRGALAPGSNPIPLAVRGSKPGRYRITAEARGAGVEVHHDILLEVVSS